MVSRVEIILDTWGSKSRTAEWAPTYKCFHGELELGSFISLEFRSSVSQDCAWCLDHGQSRLKVRALPKLEYSQHPSSTLLHCYLTELLTLQPLPPETVISWLFALCSCPNNFSKTSGPLCGCQIWWNTTFRFKRLESDQEIAQASFPLEIRPPETKPQRHSPPF